MFFIIAPHVVAEGQLEMADYIAREVGKSSQAAPGFVNRLVCHVLTKPEEVWSLVAWRSKADFENWLKVRKLPWEADVPKKVYAEGAAISEALQFDLLEEQGQFFNVFPPAESKLGTLLEGAPAIVVAPHVIKKEELSLGRRLIKEVGHSAKKAKGFIGRIEIMIQGSETRLWSISTWKSYADFDVWKDVRTEDFWWKPEINHIVFDQGALVEEAVMMQIVTRE